MAEPIQNYLGQFDQKEKNVLFNVYKKWRDSGADKSGAPLADPETNQIIMDYKDATEGYQDPVTGQFKPPTLQKIDGIDLKSPLEIKAVPDVTQQIKEQEDNALDTRIKKQEKQSEKAALSEPSFLSQLGSNALEAGKGALGFSMGVAEAVNPLSIPHFVEQTARSFGEDADPKKDLWGRISERMAKAGEKTVSPRLDIGELSAGIRTGADTIGSLAMLDFDALSRIGQTYDTELKSQRDFEQSGNMPLYKTTGELTAAVPGLIQLGKAGVKGVANAVDYVGKLKPGTVKEIITLKKLRDAIGGISRQAITDANLADKAKTPLRQAQETYAEMLGDTAGEIGDAIYKRTEKVEDLVKGTPEARSLFPEVQKLREHIDGTEQFIGEAVGEFRNFILNQKDVRVNTTGLVNKLGRVKNNLTLESGASATESKDLQTIAKFQYLLNAPKKSQEIVKELLLESGDFDEILVQLTPKERLSFINELTKDIPIAEIKNTKDIPVSDALRISDSIDVTVQKLKNAPGNASKEVLGVLMDIRKDIKNLLHEKFPAYSKADEIYAAYKNTANSIRSVIESRRGEAFLSNLYGANKTEDRILLEELINQGRDASKAVKEMGREAKFGIREVNKEASALVNELKNKAAELEFPEAQQFFNDIADKVAARSLAKYKSSGQADFPADKVREMQNRFIKRSREIAKARGQVVGGAFGSVVGGASGTLLGLLLAKGGGPLERIGSAVGLGGFGATYAGGKAANMVGSIAESAAGWQASNKAKDMFTPVQLLEMIKRVKTTSPELRSIISDTAFIEKQFGVDEAVKFLNIIPVSPQLKSAVENVTLYSATKGAAEAVEEKNLGPFGQFLDFTQGSEVTPKKKGKK